jgi:hypothetical protein
MATKNLFQNIVFATSIISAVTLSAPSIKTLVIERKWTGEQTWVVLAAIGSTIATTWVRYLDTDGELYTPRGLPGRDPDTGITMQDVSNIAGSITSNFINSKKGDS